MPEDDPCPEPPERPSDDMCCGRGCIPCIFDYYEDALARYQARLKAWQERHPDSIRVDPPASTR